MLRLTNTANKDKLALIAIDACRSIALIITHTCIERTIDGNLKIVRPQSMAMCIGVREQTTLLMFAFTHTT